MTYSIFELVPHQIVIKMFLYLPHLTKRDTFYSIKCKQNASIVSTCFIIVALLEARQRLSAGRRYCHSKLRYDTLCNGICTEPYIRIAYVIADIFIHIAITYSYLRIVLTTVIREVLYWHRNCIH